MAFSLRARPFMQRLSAACRGRLEIWSRIYNRRKWQADSYLFVRRKDGKAGAGRLVLIRGAEGPERDRTTAKLSEPALQLGLRGVVGESAQMKNLAALGQEGTNVRSGIHGTGEDLGMLMRGLRLPDQAAQHSGQGDGLLHSAPGRGGSQRLQVEGKVVLDGGGGLDGLDFEGGADVGERAGAEGQRLGVVSLPSLIFGTEVECPGVLKVCRKHDCLVPSLTRQLYTKIPRIQRHKGELQVLADEVFLGESVEAVDGVAESACRADVFPCQSRQARFQRPSAIEPRDG